MNECFNLLQVAKCLARRLHTSPGARGVAMSRFDPESPLPYKKLNKNLEIVKKRLNRPMTLSEKVLYSHLEDPHGMSCINSGAYIKLLLL